MPTIAKIGPKLAFCVVVTGLFLVFWAARSFSRPGAASRLSAGTDQRSFEPDARRGKNPSSAAAAQCQIRDHRPGTPEDPPRDADLAAGPQAAEAPPGLPANEIDDPEKAASAFVDQNQKHAEAQLKTLKEEAEKLRARLTKVEAGIKRWDRVLEALKQSQGRSRTRTAEHYELIQSAARFGDPAPGLCFVARRFAQAKNAVVYRELSHQRRHSDR